MISVALAFVLATLTASSLETQTTAALQGRVLDESGALLPGATISVRGTSTGFDRSVISGGEGRYHIIENTRSGLDPSGLALTAGLKTYF